MAGATEAQATFAARQAEFIEDSDGAVKAAHEAAREGEVITYFDAAPAAEATRQFDLLSAANRRWTARLADAWLPDFDREPPTVNLKWPAPPLAAGHDAILVEVDVDYETMETALTLWG